MRFHAIFMASILVIFILSVQSTDLNGRTDGTLTINSEEVTQSLPTTHRFLRQHKKDKRKEKQKNHSKKHHTEKNHKKDKLASHSEKHKTEKRRSDSDKGENKPNRHEKAKHNDSSDTVDVSEKSAFAQAQKRDHHGKNAEKHHMKDDCSCDLDWSVTTCEKWDAGNLLLTLDQEICAEECCTIEPQVQVTKTNQNIQLLGAFTQSFQKGAGEKKEYI